MTFANGTLKYGLHIDRDFTLDIAMTFQQYLPFFSMATVHPLVFYILYHKGRAYNNYIRWAYICDQVTFLIHEFNFGFLFRFHLISPYAALYCEGPICRANLPKPLKLGILAFFTVAVVPSFIYLLLRIHSMLDSFAFFRLKFSNRVQAVIEIGACTLLLLNVYGYVLGGFEWQPENDYIKSEELSWLIKRGGTLFFFGPPGQPQSFSTECAILGLSIIVIAPLAFFVIFHSLMITKRQLTSDFALRSRVVKMREKLNSIFLAQALVVGITYAGTLITLDLVYIFDVSSLPPILIAIIRLNFNVLVSGPLMMSLVFIMRNDPRKIMVDIWDRMVNGRNGSFNISNATPSAITAR